MNEKEMTPKLQELMKAVDTSNYMTVPISEWRTILAKECGVYVCGEWYLARRFDQINYSFRTEHDAVRIVKDNLFALLRFKYFTKTTDDSDTRIQQIVSSFIANLRTTLIKVSLDNNDNCIRLKTIPAYCVAFRNGVYNFKDNDWLIRYKTTRVEHLHTTMYSYDSEYAIFWFFNFDFEPWPINIMEHPLELLIETMKEATTQHKNYCFELMYNMSHDYDNIFSYDMFLHLCEVMGYAELVDFNSHFVVLVARGGNGKNSLFDGCFTSKVVPAPASLSLRFIEENAFVTGALENKWQNFFFESSTTDDPFEESMTIKGLTGSTYQSIHHKGIDPYSGYLNCKQIHSANDQEKLKWTDTSDGFRRRINVFEMFYKWDKEKRFLTKGDYYDTSFSDSLDEIKSDVENAITFIYFGMYGLKEGTNGFTKNFDFTLNDWKLKYSDIDIDLKDKIESVSIDDIIRYMEANNSTLAECKTLFFDISKTRLYLADSFTRLGYNGYDDLIKMLKDAETSSSFFTDNEVYINLKLLKSIIGLLDNQKSFTQSVMKIYNIFKVRTDCYNNQPYVRCRFIHRKLRILQ